MENACGTCAENQPEFHERTTLGTVAFVLTGVRQAANTVASRVRIPRERNQAGTQSDQTDSPVVPDDEAPGAPNQRTLDLGLAQAKGFISTIASKAAISGSPTVGSNVNWQFATRGIDLLLTSSREFASRLTPDQDAHFERSTYINGAQHVLRALPRDLSAAEAAVLHRALPHSVAHPGPAPGFFSGWRRRSSGQRQDGSGAARKQNVVHSLVVVWLYCVCTFAVWLEFVGVKVVEHSMRHGSDAASVG
ncbi:hypothetical protein B0I37DRAFT_443250 [Chaetomium sp. MPI-CAGE-AT-0009]|nr:hypothetical protein B0I37DRAFT_443250 [Chaetomium sp. MPI-CAGE-AT-0009]